MKHNFPDEFYSSTEGLKISAQVDVYSTPFVNRYRNWIVPKDAAKKFHSDANSNLAGAVASLKNGLVLVDPVVIYKDKEQDNVYPKIL